MLSASNFFYYSVLLTIICILLQNVIQFSHDTYHHATIHHLNHSPKSSTRKLLWHWFFPRNVVTEDSKMILANSFNNAPGFYHGVASGDPLNDSVILWTRYTPVSQNETISIELRMAPLNLSIDTQDLLNPDKNPQLRRAIIDITEESDYIAKIEVVGLKSKTKYVYSFSDGAISSDVGQTQTAPSLNDTVGSLTYAFFSCSHYSNGYFHAYDVASTIKDLDFWIHVGDYVYEYGAYYDFATDVESRRNEILPRWETISLQDHRNRYATYHSDKALQNLRRRAPMLAVWDDHETANNAYGSGEDSNTGAQNHQPVCPVNPSASNEDKISNSCDRNEGDAAKRFNNAAQAYLEWLPIRRGLGSMGVVDIGTITQVISWGKMATFVGFDTRISHRSAEPTQDSNTITSFIWLALRYTNLDQFSISGSRAQRRLLEVADGIRKKQEDTSFTLIGSDIEILRTNFARSKDSGQPWQIWMTATALGRSIKGNFLTMGNSMPDSQKSASVNQIMKQTSRSWLGGLLLRAVYMGSLTNTPWGRDDYSGYAHEQKEILKMLNETTLNPIVLGGDLHDSYAWQLYEDGLMNGTPIAVNLICPGVTSPGWGPQLKSALSALTATVGSPDELVKLVERADEMKNPGLKFTNLRHKGFVAVKVTATSHVAEYFGFTPEIIVTPYDQAISQNSGGGLTASFFCNAQLTTTAGARGSLERSDNCSVIEFDTSRPSEWSIPFPAAPSPVTKLSDCGYYQCKFNV